MIVPFERQLKNLKKIPKLQRLRLTFLIERLRKPEEMRTFRCNICNKSCTSPVSEIRGRECSACYHCASTLRFRALMAVLSELIYGRVIPVPLFERRKHLSAIGMSDSVIYADRLRKKFSYTNTFYEKRPRLDIMQIPDGMKETADFVICSDVFEHVLSPVSIAFSNLFKILKKDGFCVFSVPFKEDGETVEHFPELYRYRFEKRHGKRVLINRLRDGREQVFDNLCFHGGQGFALEMRHFSKPSLLTEIKKAGFGQVRFYADAVPEYGILPDTDAYSAVMSLHKV